MRRVICPPCSWRQLMAVGITLTFLTTVSPVFGQTSTSSTVVVRGFTFTGNTVISKAELDALTQPYVDAAADLRALEQVAELVAEHYKQNGYTLAKAYIPQQDIRHGIVEIAILEGRLDEISVTGNRSYSTKFIRSHFAKVMEDRVIRNVALERSLLLLNKYPDLKVSAVLEPGDAPGSTNIRAKVEDKRPLHATLDFNNYGFNTVSRYRFGAGIEIGNFLVDGGTFKLNGILGVNPNQLQFLTGAYAVPLGVHGTKLVASGSVGKFDVGAELAALQIRGRIHTYDVSLIHPFIKTRRQSLLVEAGFASKDNRLSALGTLTGKDQVRMVKLGINYDRLDSSGRTYLSLYGYQGLGEWLGGMDNNSPLSIRQGADGRFTKATATTGRIQSLGKGVLFLLKGSSQITTGPVVVIEQKLLGGPDSVRGYQLGERFVDEGYTVTAEARIPVLPSLLPATQASVFVDHGGGRVRRPQPGEKAFSSLTGTGFGVHTELPYYSFRLRAEIGFPLGPTPRGGTIAGGRSPTFYIQAMTRF